MIRRRDASDAALLRAQGERAFDEGLGKDACPFRGAAGHHWRAGWNAAARGARDGTRMPRRPPLRCPDCGGAMPLQMMPETWRRGTADRRRWVYLCEARAIARCTGLIEARADGTPITAAADLRRIAA